jgi:hypothetical protein
MRSFAFLFSSLALVLLLSGCSAPKPRPGSIASIIKADQDGLEVEQTVDDQARVAVMASPRTFVIAFDDDRMAWERARFFFEKYVNRNGAQAPVISKVIGSRWALTNGKEGQYSYEVWKDSVAQGFKYTVRCTAQQGGQVQEAHLHAGNLARFIREGKLEVSLLPKA